jgi:hypothetical protein
MTETKSSERVNDIRQFFLDIEHAKRVVDRVDTRRAAINVNKEETQDEDDMKDLTFQISNVHVTKQCPPAPKKKKRRIPIYLRTDEVVDITSIVCKLWGGRGREKA